MSLVDGTKYACRAMSMVYTRARARYRYYRYWKRQERVVRACSLEELAARQWRQFKQLLDFAWERIPYYRERYEQAGVKPAEIRSREDLQRLPMLTKDDIRRNFPDRMVESARRIPLTKMGQTSGSTGESIHFMRADDAWRQSLYYSVFLCTRGLRNLAMMVLTTPHCAGATCSLEEDAALQDQPIRRFQRVRALRHVDHPVQLPSSANILGETDEYMERLRLKIAYFAPCVMIVDPVYFGAFARYLKRSGKPMPQVQAIITTFELLTPSVDDLLQEVFRCPVYTQYGASETPDIAVECEHHNLHVRPDNVLVEVLRDGRPAEPDELGRVVVTALTNFNMPFIRYDIGDVIAGGDGPCPCGRNSETLGRVQGRAGDLLRTGAAGDILTPLQADAMFRGLPGIAAYQLVQRTESDYDVAILPDDPGGRVDEDALRRRGRSLIGEGSRFQIEHVAQIMPEKSWKFRFVCSDLADAAL